MSKDIKVNEDDKSYDSQGDDDIISEEENISKENKILDKINENDEDNYSTNKETDTKDFTDSFLQESPEVISILKQKIKKLEDQVANLKKKNDELTKDNIHNDRKMKRISFVGLRKKFTIGAKDNESKIKMAELLKEKNDLQEINENMLNMLTEKELENEELQENFTNYKNEMKLEIEKYIDTIDKLEEKISENNQNKANFDSNLDEIIQEYNIYKDRMEKTLKEHIKKEDELNVKLARKESVIIDIKTDMENLEIENKQLKSLTEQKEDEYNNEILDINSYMKENEKLKNEILVLQEKIKKLESKNQNNISSKEEEINTLKEDLDFKSKSLTKIKEEKNKEINLLKMEINRNNHDINSIIKKNELIQKENEEIKSNLEILQNKLDKKTKELQEINDSAKKLLENKDNIIKEYEKEIEEISKDKNQLIEQNHDLLDKIKNNQSSNNLKDILFDDEENENENGKDSDEYFENLLLKAEIKTLKEQLENQANDLISLNAMEKEVSRLKIENEKLEKDNKTLKKIQKYDMGNDNLMNLSKRPKVNISAKKLKKKISITILQDPSTSKKSFFEKKKNTQAAQITTIKNTEDSNKAPSPVKENKESDEINKLREEIGLLKVEFLNKEFENETLIAKYKGIIKSFIEQCKKMGISLNLDLNKI